VRGKKVRLESLSVGHCFTLPVEPGPPEERGADATRHTAQVLAAADAWKVIGSEEEHVRCVNAAGEERPFASDLEVVEIPRQGYDRLVARAR